jgi:flagellum-specific ATP synthase
MSEEKLTAPSQVPEETTEFQVDWNNLFERVKQVEPIKQNGRVVQVIGLVIESQGPAGSVGELCYIVCDGNGCPIPAEIVGFKEGRVLLMPLGEMHGIHPGSEVIATGSPPRVGVGDGLLGRVVDSFGRPIDGGPPLQMPDEKTVFNAPPSVLGRRRIEEPLPTGIRSIDGMVTCGRGQRVGIFSGSGVGKSVLLGMIAQYTAADVNVIALIGERGREVREFIERDLGPEGLARSVVVVATSDKPALVRIQGAMVAITLAEYFRDQGKDVMFMMDSLTRFSMAQREVGLAIGEPPTTRGYTPSVFAMLPRFLERAGTTEHHGSITGLYTVLVEQDDMNDPVADSSRAVLDGHIVLSRTLAERGHYPSVDVLQSVSRLMMDIVSPEHLQASRKLQEILSVYQQAEDLINIGAYREGSNPRIDEAIRRIDGINRFLTQDRHDGAEFKDTVEALVRLMQPLPGNA